MTRVELIVFLSLLLDLFAFTIPLPLFPRLIEWYTLREASSSGLLSQTLRFVSSARNILYQPSFQPRKWDIVLLGGLMGSIFSTLQFFVSPIIGSLSDKYGRKRILLISVGGNILSAIVWIHSTTFASYMLSRVIGGISEGNVQLAIAILSDVTAHENRSRALALVGIAFAVCFSVGPPVGAYFAARPFPKSTLFGYEVNVYATPAALSLGLLAVEVVFLAMFLQETHKVARRTEFSKSTKPTRGNMAPEKSSMEHRVKILKVLRISHFFFLLIFSGMEFTISFLTFDLLDWGNKQNGFLYGSIGIMSALVQGGYVRRVMSRTGEGVIARRGVLSCALGLVLLSIFPRYALARPGLSVKLLQGAAVFMAFTSATVVNGLTAYASLQCDDDKFDPVTGKDKDEKSCLQKGHVLGTFRSSGQLGRAIGPLLACSAYWTLGPSATYCAAAIAMFVLGGWMNILEQ